MEKIMKIKKLIRLIPCKENNFAIIDKTISQNPGVYLLFDYHGLLLYIGKTRSIRNRIVAHVSDGNKGTYELGDSLSYGFNSTLPRGVVKYLSYLEIDSELERSTTELMLIHLLKPFFNFGSIEEKTKAYLKDYGKEGGKDNERN